MKSTTLLLLPVPTKRSIGFLTMCKTDVTLRIVNFFFIFQTDICATIAICCAAIAIC